MGFYIFCGGDGLGKTTVAKYISAFICKPYFKFPYGSDGDTVKEIYSGKRIRAILNDKEHTCDPVAFQALQLVNKLEAVAVLKELERKHGIVFVDRWSLSALIYGAADGVDREWNEIICKFFDDQIKPSLMFIFVGKPFKNDGDRYGAKQKAIAEMYEDYIGEHLNDMTVVEINVTDKSIDAVSFEVLGHITRDILAKRLMSCATTSTVVRSAKNIVQSTPTVNEETRALKSCFDSMVI